MKTRILSGIVLIAIVCVVLSLGYVVSPWFITATIAFLGSCALYEIAHNATGIDNKSIIACICIYPAVTVIVGYYSFVWALVSTVLYGIVSVILILWNHDKLNLGRIAITYGMPVPIALSFYAFNMLINHFDGLYYLLLLFGFSCVCDMGAYFTGVAIGKHKLCPKISPKKTIEGVVGGVLSSIIFVTIISILFDNFTFILLLIAIPLCILGIIGDLFASVIKRSVGLKDYSNLIPGHGGVMDRFDSIIMITPLMFVLVYFGII